MENYGLWREFGVFFFPHHFASQSKVASAPSIAVIAKDWK
jgi:hypothetical protein